MKIAFLNIYQNNIARGSETFVAELGKRLKESHQVHVISSYNKVPERWPVLWRTYLDPQGIKIFIFTLKNLPKIWKEKYDVVIPLNGGWQSALVRLVTWIYGGRMIISGQSGDGWDDRNNLWCFPDLFVGLSSKSVSWAKKSMPFVKSVYIPNGVDTKKFTQIGNKFKVSLSSPIVLTVGALTHQKRIDLVIKAVSKLKEVNLLVVGDGYLKKEIKKLGNDLLGKRFMLTNVEYSIMPSIYRSVDLFTLVSESSESFGNVFVEAMATNLPVVARNDAKRREIVGDAGIFVDPNNLDEFVDAISKGINREWKNEPISQAKKFDWSNIVKLYNFYLEEFKK